MAREVAGIEMAHLQIAQTRELLPLVRDTFGRNLVSRQLLCGLMETRQRYFNEPKMLELDLETPMGSVEEIVRAAEELLEEGLSG
jgi:hypothetical protein